MEMLKKLYESNWLLFIVTGLIFGYGAYTHNVNMVILLMLEFTVIFELVRTFNHYLKDGTLKVRYGIDAAIFFTIKELYIGFSEFKLSLEHSVEVITSGAKMEGDYRLILISLGALCILMVVRYFNSKMVEEKAKLCSGGFNCSDA